MAMNDKPSFREVVEATLDLFKQLGPNWRRKVFAHIHKHWCTRCGHKQEKCTCPRQNTVWGAGMNAMIEPSDALLDWAIGKHVNPPLFMPLDRPWVPGFPPPKRVDTYDYVCVCKKEKIKTKRYPCTNGLMDLYIGQCQRCHTIAWAYRQRGENE